MIAIIDYDLGNLASVQRAVRYLGADVMVTEDPELLESADKLILPGVGDFAEGIRNLKTKNLIEPIQNFVHSGKPILGICLGMQLFLSKGEESGTHSGLDLIPGRVVHFSKLENFDNLSKVPHVGWNRLVLNEEQESGETSLLGGLDAPVYTYFVHSFVAVPDKYSVVAAYARYGDTKFCAVIQKENVHGCQFHPENSGSKGLHILRNFIQLN